MGRPPRRAATPPAPAPLVSRRVDLRRSSRTCRSRSTATSSGRSSRRSQRTSRSSAPSSCCAAAASGAAARRSTTTPPPRSASRRGAASCRSPAATRSTRSRCCRRARPSTGAGRSSPRRSTSRSARPGCRWQRRSAGRCSRCGSSSRRAAPPSSTGSRSTPSCASSSTPTATGRTSLIAHLASAGCVDTLDFKGIYRAEFGSPPDPELYARIADAFPGAWLEDPALTPETLEALARASRPDHVGRRDPRMERRRGAAVPASLPELQAVAVRLGAAALRLLRRVRAARDRALRRRPVRARPGPRPDPDARLALPRRRAERRRARGLQRSASRSPGCPASPLALSPAPGF